MKKIYVLILVLFLFVYPSYAGMYFIGEQITTTDTAMVQNMVEDSLALKVNISDSGLYDAIAFYNIIVQDSLGLKVNISDSGLYNELLNYTTLADSTFGNFSGDYNDLTNTPAIWLKSDSVYSDSILSVDFSKVTGDTVTKTYVDAEISTISLAAANLQSSISGQILNSKINNLNITYPQSDTYPGVTYNVSTETEIINAVSVSSSGDIINLTADITLTGTLTINKSVKITGNFTLYNSTNTTMINVTADSVYISSEVTISHQVVNSVSVAVNVQALNFISEATINFYEFGYILRGSFNISGFTNYSGGLGNSHRHIAIYKISEPSTINNLTFDFPEEATVRSNIIFISYSVLGDSIDANLKVSNCFQYEKTKRCRQFIFFETLIKSDTGTPSLSIENCVFNAVNGDIGLYCNASDNISFFDYIVLLNNHSGTAAVTPTNNYKGLIFLDAYAGGIRDIGVTDLYTFGNIHSVTVRSSYYDAIESGLIGFNPAYFTDSGLLVKSENLQINNAVYNYTNDIASKKYTAASLALKVNIDDSGLYNAIDTYNVIVADSFTRILTSYVYYNSAFDTASGDTFIGNDSWVIVTDTLVLDVSSYNMSDTGMFKNYFISNDIFMVSIVNETIGNLEYYYFLSPVRRFESNMFRIKFILK